MSILELALRVSECAAIRNELRPARKLIYLAINNAVPQWTRTRGWTKALLAFKIHFGDRLPD